MRPSVLTAAALLLLPGASRAGFVATAVVDGYISGTFLGRSFTGARVEYTLTYYTDDVRSGFFGPPSPYPPFLPPWSAGVSGTGTVSVEGVGSAGLGRGSLSTTKQPARMPLLFPTRSRSFNRRGICPPPT